MAGYFEAAAQYDLDPTPLQELINNSTDLGRSDRQGLTLLHYACREGHLKAVQMLVRAGVGRSADLVPPRCKPQAPRHRQNFTGPPAQSLDTFRSKMNRPYLGLPTEPDTPARRPRSAGRSFSDYRQPC